MCFKIIKIMIALLIFLLMKLLFFPFWWNPFSHVLTIY